jgi:hypothetical protein
MEPKSQSNAGSSLSSLSNSINTGMGAPGTSPQYTPPGTPANDAPEPARAPFYAPPSFASRPTPVAPVASAPMQPAAAPYTPPTPAASTSFIPPTPLTSFTPAYAQQPPSAPVTVLPPSPTYAAPQSRSRFTVIIASILAVAVILVTGLLYLYGSHVVAQKSGAAQGAPDTVPTNGFQVTESGVTEPNFDSQYSAQGTGTAAPLDSATTDAANMFEPAQ